MLRKRERGGKSVLFKTCNTLETRRVRLLPIENLDQIIMKRGSSERHAGRMESPSDACLPTEKQADVICISPWRENETPYHLSEGSLISQQLQVEVANLPSFISVCRTKCNLSTSSIRLFVNFSNVHSHPLAVRSTMYISSSGHCDP